MAANARKPAKHFQSQLRVGLLRHLQERRWVRAGQRIGVAVSGGADSVAQLLLLLELRETLGMVVSVVHFNHKLRGRVSQADEKFVANLAARHGLRLHVEGQDISAKAKRERINLEDAARRARYGFFERLVSEGQVDRVAVAHTADDQAETVLAHIFRGTGLAGLGGVHPEAGCVFRPLLGFRRAELRRYLRMRGQAWREDSTNRDTKRTRARIRLKVMPVLERQFPPGLVEHLCRLAELAREDEEWLESSAELRVFLNAKEENGEWRMPLEQLAASPRALVEQPEKAEPLWQRQAPQAMSKRVIRRLVQKVKPHAGQCSSVHVEAVLRLAQQPQSGKSLPLPGGAEVRREHDALVFRAATKQPHGPGRSTGKPFSHMVKPGPQPVSVTLLEPPCCLRFTVIDWPPQGRETSVTGAVLDRDRAGLPLVVRNWQAGDRMQPLGHQKPHRLSRLLNELGVSRWKKEVWPVVACGGKIAWARGLPVSAEFAPDSSTREGVVITEVPSS